MKKLRKIKLNQFTKDELDQRKMNALKGGCVCNATCSGCVMCDVTTINGYLYGSADVAVRLTEFTGGGEVYNY